MKFISYAQNFEDVILWRALGHVENGFYVDVGAWHPQTLSVSKAFYDHGWRGIDIEPDPKYSELLRKDRPGETVMEVAISDVEGEMTLNIIDGGLSTADDIIAETGLRQLGNNSKQIRVPVLTLKTALKSLVNRDVHWMKIDVEGFEDKVLKGWDSKTLRPWVLVVEATIPLTAEPNYKKWEPILIKAGYVYVYSDRLNRFYVAKEHSELIPSFSYPPNIFDNFITNELDVFRSQLDTTKSQLDTTKSQLDTTKSQLDTTKSQLDLKVNELNTIYYSRGWRFVIYIRKLLNYFIPRESLRRRISSFLYNFSKRGVKLVLKIRSKIFSLFLKIKNYIDKPKSYKRKINRDSKKIVYVGHSYHNKTKSTTFLIDYLKEFFEVEVVLDESWLGKPFPDLSFVDESYLGVVFFQLLPPKDILININNDNVICFPMQDHAGGLDFDFWKDYRCLKMINFSKTLHNKLLKFDFESMYIQYFPKPERFIPGDPKQIFFWQRLSNFNINTLVNLFKANLKIHIHRTVDPGQEFITPSKSVEKKFNITYSDWFNDKEGAMKLIRKMGIYVAPREYEGIGMTFLEAMAMGKAVVAVDNPTMNEYIVNGLNGYLFNLKKPKEIDLSNMEQIQKNAYEYMQEGFKGWEKNKQNIINFIKQ